MAGERKKLHDDTASFNWNHTQSAACSISAWARVCVCVCVCVLSLSKHCNVDTQFWREIVEFFWVFLMVPWQPVHELLSILAHLPDMWICSSAADRFPKCWEALRSLCKIQQLCLFTREENHTFIHRANTVPPFLLLMAYFCRQHDVFNRLSPGLLDHFLSKAYC